VDISFHGAARTVTGSKHIVHLDSGKKILLDCGLFQGLGKETIALNSNWGFDPRDISYVVISHAHVDHIGLLPKLVKDGYRGEIFCTPETAELGQILLLDSAHIQEAEMRHVNKRRDTQERPRETPLYTEEDVVKAMKQIVTVPYGEPLAIDDEIKLMYTNAGHILGAASVNLKILENGKEIRLAFSGDVGRYGDMLLESPSTFPQADYIILESTYGNQLHELPASATDKLLRCIEYTCFEKEGKLIVPCFAVGRTQEILYLLNRLELEHRLPAVNYYIDSPLATAATQIVNSHPEEFNADVQGTLRRDEEIFSFKGMHYTKTAQESMALTATKEPCVIIAASGMAEAGRVKHHIAGNIENPANTILITGHCEPNSLGGKLMNGDKNVLIYGEPHEVRAEVQAIESLSAHGDYDDLLRWLDCQDKKQVRKIFLVHGEYETQIAFRGRLQNHGYGHVEIPALHQKENCD
jgi:metallo-beta-lactamase family protein